jgi:hypothetical protein
MPAELLPVEAIPGLAARLDSPVMLRVLRRLQQAGFLSGQDVDRETSDTLHHLAGLGLVDPAYDGPANGKPFVWVRNHNGDRVLRYFDETLGPKIKVHPRAHTALESLSQTDREAVWAGAEAFLIRGPASWPREQAVQLSPDKPAYLLRVSPDLRAFVNVLPAGNIELSDIVREETLRLFLERHGAGTRAG